MGDVEGAKEIARDKIRDMRERTEKALPAPAEPEQGASLPLVHPGDSVRLKATGSRGTVRSLHGGDTVTVEVGGKSLRVGLALIEPVDAEPAVSGASVVVTHDASAPSRNFSSELKVIGLRLADALERVDKYLDDAAVLGVENLRIVHGKGEGVLSGAIAKMLEESLLVASYGWARPEDGGWGVTTVEMVQRKRTSEGVS
jgi:DNA mismatch repair protein MutS2